MNAICRLHHLGILKASGSDAASFLQGQLSSDIIHMPEHLVRLAAYCSAQGKMLASFFVCKTDANTYYLIGSADLLPATLKRLNMFVLRAKVEITDVSASLPAYGLTYDESLGIPALPPENAMLEKNHLHIELTSVGNSKRRMIIALDNSPLPQQLQLPELPQTTWQWLNVQSGVALVNDALRDRFIPQMFNYESVGGIDFKKGCYPGQEVISRSQFRGTLKRKLFLLHSDQALQINDPISVANTPEEVCGEIVLAAPAPQGGYAALAVLRTDSTTQTLANALGAHLSVMPLPYPIKDDF